MKFKNEFNEFNEFDYDKLNEGWGDTKFGDIFDAIDSVVNIKAAKEKVIDGVITLLLKISGNFEPDELDSLEDQFKGYYFSFDYYKHVISASQD